MAFMEKLKEGTLADAIEKLAAQSQQQNTSEAAHNWDHPAMAPGHSLRDFLHDPPPTPSPLQRGTSEGHGPQNQQQTQSLADREDAASVPGVCGLLNMGNTCYMNAGLQCIRAIPEIALYYLSSAADAPLSSTSHQGHLSCRLATLLHKFWSGTFSAIHPKAFKATLGVLHPQFSDNTQQDCQEFLAMVLDSLHQDAAPDHPMEDASNQIADSRSHDQDPLDQMVDETKGASGDDCRDDKKGSVVIHTFQGMLKNEVLCQKCHHLSTKEEPFFYLSVPLPHAHERQIYVQWVPICHQPGTRRTVRLLVTVLKVVTVATLKDAVVNLIGRPLSHDLIQLAEVKDNCIFRMLSGSIAVKQIDDKTCEVFAFELSPLPDCAGEGEGEGEREEEEEREVGQETSVLSRKHGKESDSETEGLPTKMFKGEEISSRDGNTSPAPVITTPNQSPINPTDSSPTEGSNSVNSQSVLTPRAVVMEWHSCAICLEEMVDTELVTHGSCGAILCPSCLQSSVDHYQKDDLVPCPICSVVVKSSEAFTPLAEPSATHHLIKLLQTTVLFRTITDGSAVCGAPPAVLRLPESAPGQDYYQAISPLLSVALASSDQWDLCLTDTKGRYCSRCLYGSGCHGCIIPRSSSTPHTLRPGDYIAVTVERRGEGEGEECEREESHPSLATKRELSLTLEECLKSFSQSEDLVGDNHWFCPSCKDFQSASQVLSVSSLPQTIIIHLKRFIYHGTTGSKVDAPVTFPLELDPRLVSHDSHMTEPLQLAACVCHFGSLNCGHYTSYVRHMLSDEWYYYNDETVTPGTPSDKDSESVYILFYRRKDLPLPTLPKATTSFDNEAEMTSVAQLLRQHKPRPTPSSRTPAPLPQRSNSIGDLQRPSSTETITAQTNHLLASLGLDPHTATIAHALPAAASIAESQGSPRSPPPLTPSSLLTPPPSNSSSITQTTSILEDYMNYDFSDDIPASTTSSRQSV